MKRDEFGRFLRRGEEEIPVEKAEDVFTAKVERPADAERLAAERDVEAVEPLNRRVVEVQVDAERRDEVMAKLRDEGVVLHHRYHEAGNPESVYPITDEITVKFKDGVDEMRIAEILDEVRVVVHKMYPHLGATYLVTVTDAAEANPLKVANTLAQYDEVEYAEPAVVNQFEPQAFPVDELFGQQWHLYSKNLDAPDVLSSADASVYEAWSTTYGSRDVVVALLDDGFDITHPDFQGTGKIVYPTDFVGTDIVPLPEGPDYHGTCCAGVALAERNDVGCVGVAPGCAFMPVRFPLSASDAWLIEIFQYVSARAHVVSCSWGPPPGYYPLNAAFRDTLAQLARTGGKDGNGLVICFAAGNYDAPLNANVAYTITWGRPSNGRVVLQSASGRILNGLAAHPDVIAVSACTSLNQKALYSNWGAEIAVAAPSNNFNPQTYDRRPGRGITTVDNEPHGEGFTPGKRYTNRFGGTSSATPLVAGVAGLVRSANRLLTPAEVKQLLQETADRIVDESADPFYGTHGGTYDAGGHSDWFGYGKVNAQHAVERAVGAMSGGDEVERESTEEVEIPDSPAPGIASVLSFAGSGVVRSIEVEVDIKHTYIGDLEVSITAPDGTRAFLHSRSGGSRDDLQRTYTIDNTPAMRSLLGKRAGGEWTLRVADRARRDVGRLKRWRLKLGTAEDTRLRLQSTETLRIPDDDEAGISSELEVTREGTVRDLAVEVDISHAFPDDVLVALVAPGADEIVLHEPWQGEDGDRIVGRYTPADVPALRAILGNGRSARGRWRLRVADVAQHDLGKLNGWALELAIE